MTHCFQILIERSGIGPGRIQLTRSLDGRVQREEAWVHVDGSWRLEGGIDLVLQRLQFWKQGAQRHRRAFAREIQFSDECGEGRFALCLTCIEEAVLGLGRRRESTPALQKRKRAAL